MLTATITFAPGQRPQEFTFFSRPGPWRFLADHAAIVLTPLCDRYAVRVSEPPSFDRFEVWPVRWNLVPDSLLAAHASEEAALKRRFLAGEYDADFEPRPTCAAEREPHWGVWRDRLGSDLLLGAQLQLCPAEPDEKEDEIAFQFRMQRKTPQVRPEALSKIRFCADFRNEATGKVATILLADCLETLLTPDEIRTSPAFRALEEARRLASAQDREAAERLDAQMAARVAELRQVEYIADRLEAGAEAVAKASKTTHLYSAPTYEDATKAAERRDVPPEFVEYVKTELHAKDRFPSASQAHKAVKNLPLLKRLRKETDQRTTCNKWLAIVHEEFHERHLVGPRRAKGPAAQRAPGSDTAKHPRSDSAPRGGEAGSDSESNTGRELTEQQSSAVLDEFRAAAASGTGSRREVAALRRKLLGLPDEPDDAPDE
jgi:hypothetical protein